MLQWLAQLASALQALHAQGCVHRDVKGDNVLVRHSDGRALLTDFGSGRYPEASHLTPDILPPGTPAYRSPEAWLFSLQHFREPKARYSAQPADDLYSLGVTAYRLVTGHSPELAEPSQDEAGTWHLQGLSSPAPHLLNPCVSPQLNAVILRMLSMRPEARGTAAQLTAALEQASQRSTPESTRPLFAQQAPKVRTQAAEVFPRAPAPAERVLHPARARSWRGRLVKAAALVTLGSWVWWLTLSRPPVHPAVVRHESAEARQQDGGTTGLGDDAATASSVTSPSVPGIQAEDTLPEPLPGQVRPDAKGRCPHPLQVPLGGGCWIKSSFKREECELLKPNGNMYKGTCYMAVFLHGRQPTSDPGRKP